MCDKKQIITITKVLVRKISSVPKWIFFCCPDKVSTQKIEKKLYREGQSQLVFK